MDELASLDKADEQWTRSEEAAQADKAALFDACATAIRAGHTADEIAARLKAGKTPEQIEKGLTFTAAYIRRKVRELGVPAMSRGPKPRKTPTAD